ncbi:MAG: lantibiotic immunity ABC transporter MutE/EpiE family permease subunit [Peptococcaceae bacterium]|nr:lantibiotic immunity ABC transporter MutE/EpiE family permease subunit [Peptococcaceae bacterium]
MKVMASEWLKYRRTFMAKLVILMPLFFAAYALVMSLLMPGLHLWNGVLVMGFNWWPVTFLPLGYGLFAGMVASQERKAGQYRVLCTEARPGAIWLGKIGGMALVALLSTLVLMASLTVACVLQGGAVPIGVILIASALCWLASLALIPLALLAATRFGMIQSLALGGIGGVAGVLLAPTALWFVCPWSWATRLMAPTVGVHPNGTVLPDGSPLLDGAVIPLGLGVALAAFVVLSVLTAVWFERREVK